VTFAVLFAGAQLGFDATFNFLTPYSHELTHGVTLSLVMIASLDLARRKRSTVWLATAGVSLGLVALTKAEVFLAAAGAAGAFLAADWSFDRFRSFGAARRGVIFIFLVSAAAPILVALALLCLAMPLKTAAAGIAGTWLWVANSRITGLPYYQWARGTDDLPASLGRIVAWTACYALVFAPAAIAARLIPNARRALEVSVAIIIAAAIAVPLLLGWNSFKLGAAFLPLPAVMLVLGAVMVARVVRGGQAARDAGLPLSLVTLATLLLAKIFFNARIFHYGFALAMPATLMLMTALVSWIPNRIARSGGSPLVFRATALSALGVVLFIAAASGNAWMRRRTFPIGSGGDFFLADRRALAVDAVVKRIRAEAQPGDLLLGLPDGSMINYLARVPSPSRFGMFVYSEMMMYGEDQMLASIEARPPRWVVLVHSDEQIFGARYFGLNYGRRMAAWVRENYRPVAQEGARPFTSDEFGVLLMQRRGQ
jgi:hypothetical protein